MATIVTDAGQDILTNRFKGSGTEPVFMAWGTGAGTAAIADTTLFTEAAEARVSGTSTRVTTTTTNDTWRLVATITASATRAITNAGNFDASSAGNLHIKGDFATINLSSGDSISFTLEMRTTN